MDRDPVFSIVIPSYNYGHYLANALDSVLLQKRSDVQILVIDDASDDNTPVLVKKYEGQIQYVRNVKNLGAGGAWRRGLNLAKGKYLVKLDADDELLPGHLNEIENAFESNHAAAMVISSVLLKRESKGTLKPEYLNKGDQTLCADEFRARLLKNFFFRMPGCALRREFLLGHEAPDPELFQIHDWEYFLRVTNGHQAILLNKPLAIYREHESSITAVACHEDRLFNDIQRWIGIAKKPGERFIDERELKILKGSFSILLLTGLGSKLNPKWCLTFFKAYFKALGLSYSGGLKQLGRFHFALLRKVINSVTRPCRNLMDSRMH